ncbi:nuclease [Kitasatospora sp. NPDC101176]|uniref:nuclease n=1 Tax=Kitasatospora sp. NPDC101176 TaxID=3364099 RepID=UPI0038230D22
MSMLLITGSYRIVGDRPDGDTVHFVPYDPAFWCDLPGLHRVKRDDNGGVSIRLDGIDALETHYQGVGDFVHQPLGLGAHAARDELLSWLGFSQVVQDDDEKVTSSTPAAAPGYLLTGGADLFGRCVALLGRGDAPKVGAAAKPARSGSHLDVTVDMLHATANHHLLSLGLVYPTFYANLPEDLRADLTTTAQQARAAKAPHSVWLNDVTTTGAKIENLDSITEDLVLLPKLFRRLADYVRVFGPGLGGLSAFLAGGGDEFTLPEDRKKRVIGLEHVVEVTDGTLRMTRPIEDLVFSEK